MLTNNWLKIFWLICCLAVNPSECRGSSYSVTSHGRRSVGGQGDMSPLLFQVEGTPCVGCVLSPPPFFGSRHCL